MRSATISEQVYNFAVRHITPFASERGYTWAAIATGPLTHQACSVDSPQFRAWLADSFFAEFGILPGDQTVRYVARMIESRSRRAHHAEEAFTRIGYRGDPLHPDSLSIDLANDARQVIEINRHGWQIADCAAWRFRFSPATGRLPAPAHSSYTPPVAESLGALLHLDPGPNLDRIVTWLFAALRPVGPYPILILSGPPGSGKSTIARIVRSVVDPVKNPLEILPASERDLFVSALHNRILVFDHVPSLTSQASIALARLSAGASIKLGKQHPFDDPFPISAQRPIILTVPSSEAAATHWSRNHTISSLAMTVALETIPEDRRRSTHELEHDYQAACGAILAGLCKAVTAALAAGDSAEASPPTRFADAHQWTAAAALVLGLTFEAVNSAFTAAPLVAAVTRLLANKGGAWRGAPSELYDVLESMPGCPTSVKGLVQQLNATALSVYGIDYSYRRVTDRRIIALSMTDATKHPSFLAHASVTE